MPAQRETGGNYIVDQTAFFKVENITLFNITITIGESSYIYSGTPLSQTVTDQTVLSFIARCP